VRGAVTGGAGAIVGTVADGTVAPARDSSATAGATRFDSRVSSTRAALPLVSSRAETETRALPSYEIETSIGVSAGRPGGRPSMLQTPIADAGSSGLAPLSTIDSVTRR
jgi:hypothetical protein